MLRRKSPSVCLVLLSRRSTSGSLAASSLLVVRIRIEWNGSSHVGVLVGIRRMGRRRLLGVRLLRLLFVERQGVLVLGASGVTGVGVLGGLEVLLHA